MKDAKPERTPNRTPNEIKKAGNPDSPLPKGNSERRKELGNNGRDRYNSQCASSTVFPMLAILQPSSAKSSLRPPTQK